MNKPLLTIEVPKPQIQPKKTKSQLDLRIEDNPIYSVLPPELFNLCQDYQQKHQQTRQYFLPPKTSKHKYTLVLDLDETLMHYAENLDRHGNH